MNGDMRITQLKQLLDEGVLTQAEYDAKKALILNQNESDAEPVEEKERPTPLDKKSGKKEEVEFAVQHSSEDELRSKRALLIGKNAEHYLPIFDNLDKSGGNSWNWCGFFFSFVWFAYRKLYKWAAIAYLTPLIGGFVLGIILYSTSLDDTVISVILRVIGLAVNIFFATVANGVYKKRIDQLVNEMPKDDAVKARFIETKGGVSVVAAIIIVALYVGEIVLINL